MGDEGRDDDDDDDESRDRAIGEKEKNEGKGKMRETGRQPDAHDQIYIRAVELQSEPDSPSQPHPRNDGERGSRVGDDRTVNDSRPAIMKLNASYAWLSAWKEDEMFILAG